MIATDGALRLPLETQNRRTNVSLLFYTILNLIAIQKMLAIDYPTLTLSLERGGNRISDHPP